MNHNPYAVSDDLNANDASGTSITGDAPSTGPLHPLSGVVAGTFLGTPMGGAVVIAISLWRLGRRNTALVVAGVTLLITIALFALVMQLPDDVNVPGSAVTLPQLLIMYLLGKQLYGRELEQQRRASGRIASAWKGAGIGLLCLVAMVPILLGIVLVAEGIGPGDLFANHGQLMEYGDDEIYIDGEATTEDANRLADALKEAGFFGNSGSSVRIRREGHQTIVSFVIKEDLWNDESTIAAFRQVGADLLQAGFEQPLSIELCNDGFEMQRSITIE